MPQRLPGFTGEYLWELDVPDHHLAAIADAIPAERFDWRPAADARSVSEVMVHIATGNLALLDIVGIRAPLQAYVPVKGDPGADRFVAVIVKIHQMEKTVTGKAEVVGMLKASLAAVGEGFAQASPEELDRVGEFFGERTTVRRIYMRVLAHTHEHMGQLIAYLRMMGMKAPWEDPMEDFKSETAGA